MSWRLKIGRHWWHLSHTAAAWISAWFPAPLQNGCHSITAFPPPLLLQLSSSLCSLSLHTITQCCWWRMATRARRIGWCFWSFSLSSHLEPSVGSYVRYAAICASGLHVSCAIKRAFVSMIDECCRVAGGRHGARAAPDFTTVIAQHLWVMASHWNMSAGVENCCQFRKIYACCCETRRTVSASAQREKLPERERWGRVSIFLH